MTASIRIALPDVGATEALGERIGARLCAGQGLGLCGDLGAGKTSLVRGVARGLGVHAPDEICSPTYLLMIEHAGPVPLVHIDAYLPAKTRGFLADGGVDYLAELAGVVVVEWADRIRDLMPAETLWVALRPVEIGGAAAREAEITLEAAFPWIESLALDGV